MGRPVLIDSGPLVAALRERDRHHAWAVAHLASMSEPCVTCEAVVSECFHLLEDAPEGAERFSELLADGVVRIDFDADQHLADLLHLLHNYRNLPMGFADACLVRMSELQPGARVFTIDTDFRIYRRNGRQMIPLVAPWQ